MPGVRGWFALSVVAMVLAACAVTRGTALAPPATVSAPLPAATGTGTATVPVGPLRFIVGFTGHGQGWRLLVSGTAKHDAELAQVAAMIRAAVPLTADVYGPEWASCSPPGVREIVLPPGSLRWIIGLANGATVTVVPDVMPCGQTSITWATDEYARLGGRPVRAVGLVPRLQALALALPQQTPLNVDVSTPTPGAHVRVTGEGWVGGDVTLTVFWCHRLGNADCTVRTLARVPISAAGRIAWSGRLPGDLPTDRATYSISVDAKNGVLEDDVGWKAP